jgi:hypothetical protein
MDLLFRQGALVHHDRQEQVAERGPVLEFAGKLWELDPRQNVSRRRGYRSHRFLRDVGRRSSEFMFEIYKLGSLLEIRQLDGTDEIGGNVFGLREPFSET